MPRVKGGPKTRQRRKKRLKLAKGQYGAKSRLFRSATESVDKGQLMLRESGFVAPPDPDTRAKLGELGYLRKSIGRTMLLAVHQHLRMSHKELWQITMAR